jgi:lysophospholipase L1-like esterase
MSRNDRIIYELLPGIKAYHEGVWVNINEDGFRDRRYPLEKGENTVRIVGLGDSLMFGQGASQDSLYLTVLEYKLNNAYPDLEIEAINTGVPGYNTAIEVETLKEKGLKYAPDIVVLGFLNNDNCLPHFIREKNDYFTFGRSYLYEQVSIRLRVLKKPKYEHLPLLSHANYHKCDTEQVPDAYRSFVGEKMVEKSIRELSRLSREYAFSVVVVFWEMPTKPVLDLVREMGFDHYIIERRLKEYIQSEGIPSYRKVGLFLQKDRVHPSSFTHRLIGGWLFEYFEENNILEPYLLTARQGAR